jgi:dethiobiotin synthetase
VTQRIPGLFITGTDTGVGKTHVTAIIARQLAAEGHKVGVYKPAASGCARLDGVLVSDDAVALWNAAGRPGPL